MKTSPSRSGPIGTPMGGNARKAAVRRNIFALIKAKDILTVQERGISEIDSNVMEVCRIATKSPSLLTVGQGRMIWAVWQKLAEANKLHGIRTATPVLQKKARTTPKSAHRTDRSQNEDKTE